MGGPASLGGVWGHTSPPIFYVYALKSVLVDSETSIIILYGPIIEQTRELQLLKCYTKVAPPYLLLLHVWGVALSMNMERLQPPQPPLLLTPVVMIMFWSMVY